MTLDIRPVAGHVYSEEHGCAPVDEPEPEEVLQALRDAQGRAMAARFEREDREDEAAARQTAWLPKVPELNPRKRHPDEPNPIFDKLDGKKANRWTGAMQRYRMELLREREQYRLEELAHRDRVHEIEHASDVLNALGGGR